MTLRTCCGQRWCVCVGYPPGDPPISPPREGEDPDARLDPWCLVPLDGEEQLLFGFGLFHPVTGGKSWMKSSPVVELDEATGRALTQSGRRYGLGRRIAIESIPYEGEEAWLAFELIVSPMMEDPEILPPRVADPENDREWVAACKMARHLGVPSPPRIPAETRRFLLHFQEAYRVRRTSGSA